MQMARNALSSAHLSAPTAGPLGAVKQAWANYRNDAASRHAANATVDALAQLDDAALADIGLHRSQILSVAQGPSDRRR
jgi:uncharacterized protein YjiS (DUF1127 family)